MPSGSRITLRESSGWPWPLGPHCVELVIVLWEILRMHTPRTNADRPEQPGEAGKSSGGWWRVAALAAVIVIVLGLSFWIDTDRLLQKLAAKEQTLIAIGRSSPVLVVVGAFGLYVAVTGLSLPGAAVLTLAFGWFFHLLLGDALGFTVALVIVSFASTTGATLAFLLSRYLFRETVQNKFRARLEKFNTALEREGAFYLFTLRLIPAVPFFVINVVMGLTPMKTPQFWWVSQLGMLPGTCAYVYAGWSVPSLQQLAEQGTRSILTPNLLIAFTLLGLFPLAAKKIVNRFRSSPA